MYKNKKLIFISIFIILVLIVTLDDHTSGRVFDNAGELHQAWVEDYPPMLVYPDGINGAWSADGSNDNMVFSVLPDADMKVIQSKVLTQIDDKDSASFVTGGNYSYKSLCIVKALTSAIVVHNKDFRSIGIDIKQNRVVVGMNVESASVQKLASVFMFIWGDRIEFVQQDPINPAV